MPSFKCGMCGELIEVDEGAVTAQCPHCLAVQAVPKSSPVSAVLSKPDAAQERAVDKNRERLLVIGAVLAVGLLLFGAWFAGKSIQRSPGRTSAKPSAQPTDPVAVQGAKENFEQMAAAGDPWAQFTLGEKYLNGDGVERNFQAAAQWYRKAAEQNHVEAQARLASLYYNGWGMEKNYPEAMKLYRRAAVHGNADAQVAVGNMYYLGLGGTSKSYSNAVWWFNMAAKQSHPWGQYYLANMYRNGLGVAKDLGRARDLYLLAAQQGHIGAYAAYESISKELK